MIDIPEILVHWHAGRSQAEIAESLDLDRKTVRKYIEPAIAAGFTPSGVPPMSEADWAPPVRDWFPHLTDMRLRQITRPQFDTHRDYISAQLKAG